MSQPTSSQPEFTVQSFFKKINEEGRLTGALCKDCNTKMIPPRPLCSRCASTSLEWFEPPKEGLIVGFSEVHVTNDVFQHLAPYVVAIIDLGDGLKIPGIVKNAKAKDLRVGQRVVVETRKTSINLGADDAPAYWFRKDS
ncbi:MAG: Zn-ribbon domain-containing OB-fold protein [Thaumarchaeota archaeon]|nr:Zn-ribbon domain-containing OB-fold protein [Nitrososphaerota archaeon]